MEEEAVSQETVSWETLEVEQLPRNRVCRPKLWKLMDGEADVERGLGYNF